MNSDNQDFNSINSWKEKSKISVDINISSKPLINNFSNFSSSLENGALPSEEGCVWPAFNIDENSGNYGNSDLIKKLPKSIWIPPWLPDETLFSLVSRAHFFSGNRLAKTTYLDIFGHHSRGLAHDVPCHLDDFVQRCGPHLGDALTIIYLRTVMGSYLPFLPTANVQDAVLTMRSERIGGLKGRLGLLASRFGVDHPLRACRCCMKEDRLTYGVAYWHTAHQGPGVWWCSRHRALLSRFRYKSNGVQRFQMHLPYEDGLDDIFTINATQVLPEPTAALLEAIAVTVEACYKLPPEFHFEGEKLASLCRAALHAKGYLGKTGSSMVAEVGKAFSLYLAPLKPIPPLANLIVDPVLAFSQVRRIAGIHRRQPKHPLRYIPLINWLFGSWEQFMNVYTGKDENPEAAWERLHPCSKVLIPTTYKQNQDRLKIAVLHQVRTMAVSPTTAAKNFGIDTQTALHWVQQAGIEVKRRPKKLTNEIRKEIVTSLEKGMSKLDVAVHHGISVVTVTRVLLANHKLSTHWHEQNSKRRQVNARKQWGDAILKNKGDGIKEAREQFSAAYAWLYRNDRQWLNKQNKLFASSVIGNHSKLNWFERDRYFHDLLTDRCINITSLGLDVKWSVGRVIQLVPELYSQMRNIHRMPTTKNLLDKLLARK